MISKLTPILPLRDIVVFPHMVAPLFVGRKQSVNALNHVMTADKKIFLLAQKNSGKHVIDARIIKEIIIELEQLRKLL